VLSLGSEAGGTQLSKLTSLSDIHLDLIALFSNNVGQKMLRKEQDN